jgi:hypothetical protein
MLVWSLFNTTAGGVHIYYTHVLFIVCFYVGATNMTHAPMLPERVHSPFWIGDSKSI